MTKTTQNTSESPPQLTRKVDVKAIRDASPQVRHHFTQADQVNQLVSASEADPDLGFHGANDGAVFIAVHQSRRPERVQARQRAVLILGVQ